MEKITTKEIGRRSRLQDNRAYSSAIKIEFFYAKSIIDIDTYTKLNTLRKLRNDFIHDGKFVTESDVNILFEVINNMIETTTGSSASFNNPGWVRSGGWHDK